VRGSVDRFHQHLETVRSCESSGWMKTN
jgi:hypothetical protein